MSKLKAIRSGLLWQKPLTRECNKEKQHVPLGLTFSLSGICLIANGLG